MLNGCIYEYCDVVLFSAQLLDGNGFLKGFLCGIFFPIGSFMKRICNRSITAY